MHYALMYEQEKGTHPLILMIPHCRERSDKAICNGMILWSSGLFRCDSNGVMRHESRDSPDVQAQYYP